MQARDTCRGSLRLVASSGTVASGTARAELRCITSQKDLVCEAISPSLDFAASTIEAVVGYTGLALKLSAAYIDYLERLNTAFWFGRTKT